MPIQFTCCSLELFEFTRRLRLASVVLVVSILLLVLSLLLAPESLMIIGYYWVLKKTELPRIFSRILMTK